VFQRDSADGLLTTLSQILRGDRPAQVVLAEARQAAMA
jgi:hypothetical protein